MNKKLSLTLLALCSIFYGFGQATLHSFNEERLDINQTGMMILGSWAIANLISSPILSARAEGSAKHFHRMNGYWNGVNLVLAGVGYYSAITNDPTGMKLAETIKEQQTIEKILLFNAGLDLGYVTAGFYLRERSKLKNSDRLKGYGHSLMLQGGFLFAFDLLFYLSHQTHSAELFKWVNSIALDHRGFSLVIKI